MIEGSSLTKNINDQELADCTMMRYSVMLHRDGCSYFVSQCSNYEHSVKNMMK